MDRNKRITKPKYEIIKEALLERIRTGQFSSDAVFCTEKMLSEQYEVSRITAKRAIEDLEQQGILYRKRGVGSFVSQKIPPVSSSASETDSKSKMVDSVSLLHTVQLLESGVDPCLQLVVGILFKHSYHRLFLSEGTYDTGTAPFSEHRRTCLLSQA